MAGIDKSEIIICSNHPEYQVPLIWTFAFSGAEYWCPYCGHTCGMFHDGEVIVRRQELEVRLKRYKSASAKYLQSVAEGNAVHWKHEHRIEEEIR